MMVTKKEFNTNIRMSTLKSFSFALLIIVISGTAELTAQIPFETYSYSGTALDISGETNNARATSWKPDGTMIFVTGRFTENVISYSLEEPWELDSAVYNDEFDLSNEFGSTKQRSRAHGLYLRNDGEKMWVFNRDEIWGYTLQTPWILSSAVHTYFMNLTLLVERGHDFDFSPDGSRLYIDDRNAQTVYETHLSTPWDITTLEPVYTLNISDQEEEVRGLEIIKDGTILLLMDTARKEILQYTLSVPYDLSTAEYLDAFDVSAQTDDPRGLSLSSDYSRIYITGRDNEEIYQYVRRK